MENLRKLKRTGNRFKDNPTCPCGKSNRDNKFVSFVGLEGRGKGMIVIQSLTLLRLRKWSCLPTVLKRQRIW